MAVEISKEEFQKKFGRPPVLDGSQNSTQTPPGFLQRVATDIKGNFGEATTSFNSYKQDPTLVSGFSTGANIAKNISGAILSPLAEAPGFKQLGEGFSKAGQAIVNTKLGNKATDFLADKFSPETLGTASDVIETGLNVAGIEGGIKTARTLPRVASQVKSKITPAINTTGRVLKQSGEGAYKTTITPQESTSRAMMAYDVKQPSLSGRIKNFFRGEGVGEKPITEANTAARQGLVGTEYQIGVQAKQASSRIWSDVVGPRLEKVKGKINMKSFLEQVEKDINKTPDLTRRGVLKEALDVIKEDYKKVSGFNLKKLQEYKEGWAEFVPEGAYKGKPIGAAVKELHNMMADRARSTIYKYAGEDIKQAYIDYGNLKSIEKAGLKSTLGDPAAKSFGRGVWEFVMNKAVTPVATLAGKVLYKTGEGLEFIGKPGAKTVGEVVGERNLIVTQKGKAENKVNITRPTRLKVQQEGKAANKIPLYGGETPPRGNLPTID